MKKDKSELEIIDLFLEALRSYKPFDGLYVNPYDKNGTRVPFYAEVNEIIEEKGYDDAYEFFRRGILNNTMSKKQVEEKNKNKEEFLMLAGQLAKYENLFNCEVKWIAFEMGLGPNYDFKIKFHIDSTIKCSSGVLSAQTEGGKRKISHYHIFFEVLLHGESHESFFIWLENEQDYIFENFLANEWESHRGSVEKAVKNAYNNNRGTSPEKKSFFRRMLGE